MKERKSMQGLIDMHCHIVPGVDDGARSMDDALNILGDEVNNGVTDVIITPHYRRGMFEADRRVVLSRFRDLKSEAAQIYPGLRMYLGCEFHANMDMELLIASDPLYRMAGTKYILLEFSSAHTMDYIRERTYSLLARGYIPVLAHVERYVPLVKNPDRVRELREMGAYIQINANALIGKDGWGLRRFTRKILKKGLVDFVGSDTHNRTDRACHLEKAYRYVSKSLGQDDSDRIFIDNPMQIINEAINITQ